MSVVDRNLENENKELKEQIKSLENKLNEFVKLFETLNNVCSSDDETHFDEDESDSDDSYAEAEEESTDEDIQPKSKLESDNLEIKINS